ncbi:MAG: hypothetical protein WD873_08255 [Candidatus Hydrogenedentales bacterium]
MLITLSATIILCLGLVHLAYTFWGPKLTPRDPELQERMKNVSPVISKKTTMWRAWIGFNASHSMGAILFGLVYGYLAMTNDAMLFASPFLLIVGAAMLVGYLLLGWRYWFSIPFTGIAVSTGCYIAGIILS